MSHEDFVISSSTSWKWVRTEFKRKWIYSLSSAIPSTTRQMSTHTQKLEVSVKTKEETYTAPSPTMFILDLDKRPHRLAVLLFAFITILIILFVMSKIYKTVNTLKFRNKQYGYYINPKYETILVNLNREIKYKRRTFTQTLKKRQFIRMRKYEEEFKGSEILLNQFFF